MSQAHVLGDFVAEVFINHIYEAWVVTLVNQLVHFLVIHAEHLLALGHLLHWLLLGSSLCFFRLDFVVDLPTDDVVLFFIVPYVKSIDL